jgi:hypothetical protein
LLLCGWRLHLSLLWRRRWWRRHLTLLRRRWRWLHLTLLRRRWRWLHLTLLWRRRWWRRHLTLLRRRWLHLTLLWWGRGLAWPLWPFLFLVIILLRRLRDHEHAIERRGVH